MRILGWPLIWAASIARWREAWTCAAIAYRWSIRFIPRRADTWLQYGKVLRRLDRKEEGLLALERALALDPTSHRIAVATMEARPRGPIPDRFGFVILGTTGLCNASCVHCPTGKAATSHVPRTPMPMPLFHKIIDGIAEIGFPITGQIAFGLFGDALVDPFVVERARYVRSRFPSLPISINTNAAAFSRQRHAVLRDMNVTIGLHCESLVPETFNMLMHPLRLERVLPKYKEILDIFAGYVHVAIPVNQANLAEVADARRWFQERKAEVLLAPMMSRCASDRRVFEALALRPLPMRCRSSVLDDLVVDCDGTVLRCCQDFERAEPIGNVAQDPLREIIFGAARKSHAQMLDSGGHLQSATCSRCFGDPMNELESFLPTAAGH